MLSELTGKDHQPGSHVDVKARTLGSTGGACPVGVSWGGGVWELKREWCEEGRTCAKALR